MTMSIAKISRQLSSLSDTCCMSYYSICNISCVSLFLCFFFCSSFLFSFLSPICLFINTQSQIVKHFCCLHDTKLIQMKKKRTTNKCEYDDYNSSTVFAQLIQLRFTFYTSMPTFTSMLCCCCCCCYCVFLLFHFFLHNLYNFWVCEQDRSIVF